MRGVSGRVPDGGGPCPLTLQRTVLLGAASGQLLRDRAGVAAAHARLVADVLAPSAARILQHSPVVERGEAGVEVWIAPHRAQAGRTGPGSLACSEVHARATGCAGRIDDLLMGPSAGVHPALDDLNALEWWLPGAVPKTSEGVFEFLEGIVEATSDLACVYKPNLGFYGAMGVDGVPLLERVIGMARERRPVILDGKFGDIGNTARAYAKMAFDTLGADAVTLNPYMGGDAVAPFLETEERFAFILGITSNPSASEIEKQVLRVGGPLYEKVAETFEARFPQPNWGWVAGSTQVEEMRALTVEIARALVLNPGSGSSGGGRRRVPERREIERRPIAGPHQRLPFDPLRFSRPRLRGGGQSGRVGLG